MNLKKIMDTIAGALSMLAAPFKKENPVHGNKELKEALVGANALTLYMVGALKDGLQLEDVTDLLDKWKNDEEFKKKLVDAAEGANKIPDEVKDMDVGEGIELAAVQVEFIDDYVEAVKKS